MVKCLPLTCLGNSTTPYLGTYRYKLSHFMVYENDHMLNQELNFTNSNKLQTHDNSF